MIGLLMGCSQDIPISPSAQLAKDVAAIDKYLAANNITAVKDDSGLRYVITKVGGGVPPTLSDHLKVKYTGRLLTTQATIDQSANPPVFFSNPLGGLQIKGWQIAFPHINKGGTATLYIPSGLAFGTTTLPTVPPNSNLIYDVELLDFN
jgi:FKBP-type peptidyl-prolyl cis-trans isomerase